MTGPFIRYDFRGELLTLAEISRRTGIKYQTLASRKRTGTQPPQLWSTVMKRKGPRDAVSGALEKWR